MRVKISLALALAAAALFANPASAAANAPEWLYAAARSPLPAYPRETNAVVLLDEQLTTVKDSGEIFTTYRRAYRILRPAGSGLGTLGVYFDQETRLTFLKGWCLPAAGKEVEVKEADAVETTVAEGALFQDTHFKILRIPGAEPGNVIGYEFEQKRRPQVLQDTWGFQHTEPVLLARFSLRLPRGWEFKSVWMNHASQDPSPLAANQWTWELTNIPPVDSEPDMPPWPAVAGRLAVFFYARGDSPRAETQSSWTDVGKWYWNLASGSRQPSPEIQKRVEELTAQTSTPLEKVRILARFVQQDIRYVAIEIGIGGYQPHPARDVMVHHYGDCKDKATLLASMLHEIGVESYYVLTHSERGYITPGFPSMLNFNHVILAIRLPEGAATSSLLAMQTSARLGPLLFFDPTDTLVPFGLLPSILQANYGLLVTADGGELLQMPLLPPTTNLLARTGKLRLDDQGTLSGTVNEERSGDSAIDRRVELQKAPPNDRAKVLENFLSTFLGNFHLNNAWADNLNETEKNLVLRYDFVAERYAKTAGALLIIRPRVLGQKATGILEEKERKYPVDLSSPSLQTDVYEIALPAGYKVDELPPPVRVDCGYLSYESEIDVANNVLRYQRTFEVKQVLVPVDKLPELKKFYRQVAADERSSAVLKRAD